jgi:hypothetical protein
MKTTKNVIEDSQFLGEIRNLAPSECGSREVSLQQSLRPFVLRDFRFIISISDMKTASEEVHLIHLLKARNWNCILLVRAWRKTIALPR